MEHRVVRLARGEYEVRQDNGGQLEIAADVTIVGQEGVELTHGHGYTDMLEVESEGVSFEREQWQQDWFTSALCLRLVFNLI